MKYTIKSKKVSDDYIITDVFYEFPDGKSELVAVTHFRPKSSADVTLGIENRYVSEEGKKDAKTLNEQILDEIVLDQSVEK